MIVYPSAIASYANCPKIMYYRRVLGIYTKSTVPQALGLFEHEARRRFYTKLLHRLSVKRKCEKQGLQLVAVASVEESLPYVLLNYAFPYSIERFKQNIVSKLLKEVDRISARLVSMDGNIEYVMPSAVEKSLRSSKLRLAGRVDCILSTVDGFVPVDFKTFGKNVEALPHELQITAYAMLIEETSNSPVSYGLVLYTEEAYSRIIRVTQKRCSMVRDITSSILKMLETKKKPDAKHRVADCNRCHFKTVCMEGD